MRSDSANFAAYNESAAKSPRFVIAHIFDVSSVYCTSHGDIPNVPGVVIQNVVRNPSAISQRIVPDEGRSEIGSFSYEIVDLNSAFTNEARDKLLNDDKSFRGKQVRLYVGYEGMDFSEFQLFQTQVIKDISFEDGTYAVSCSDITREQREEIFDPKKTTLRDNVDAVATTIPVYSTTGFSTVFHGASYSDGPSSTVGYFRLEEEAIRYTGKTADTFTGCTRGVLNTKAVPHSVDASASADRRPKVEEVIYLELPAPKLAYAILTGVLHGDSASLPSHWHCGISTTLVRLSDFTGIGRDLWNTGLDTEGFVVRFDSLAKVDAKKFLESELYQVLGCYSPIYSDGTIGLKKMNPVLADAAFVLELNESNVVEAGELKHNFSGMHNRLRIDWNWSGKGFTRSTIFVDAQSITIHGEAPLKKLQFKGLHGSRHTEAIIRKRLDAFRDRYSAPPETIQVRVMPSVDRLEVGDVVRLKLAKVRDFAGATTSISRSFEIQRKSQTNADGEVTLDLFGSTAPASTEAPNSTGGGSALPDAFYTSQGTNLTTVCTIVPVGGVGVIQPGTYNLAGNADMNAAGAIYYYDGPLELANGATLTVNNNVQIRAKGFFTINGVINGIGRGSAGVASSGGVVTTNPGVSGFVGNSRGMDGVRREVGFRASSTYRTVPCAITLGQHATFPFIELRVSGNSLLGLPGDLRGTSGGGGGKLTYSNSDTPSSGNVIAQGGTGAASGAGLTIISRGSAFGASASINLSGNSSAATSVGDLNGTAAYPGSGGAGSPGAFLLLIDGSSQPLPDLGGKFVAACGAVPINGNPLTARTRGGNTLVFPLAGYIDEALVSNVDLSKVAYRIQYIPGVETPQQDQVRRPAAPTGLSVSPGERINTVRVTPAGPLDPGEFIEVFAAIGNDRATAVRFAYGSVTEFTHDLPSGGTRYYWSRIRKEVDGPDVFSDWTPSSATGGIAATALDFAGEVPSKTGEFLDTFEHQDVPRFYNVHTGSPILSYPTNGENGGRVLRCQNYGWFGWKKNIPYDPSALYVMTARVRMVQAATGGANDLVYLGVEGVAADGVTWVNSTGVNSFGSQHYFCASGYDMGAAPLNSWVTFRGYIQGFNTSTNTPGPSISNPSHMYNDTIKYMRPLMILNYDGGNGIMEVDYVRLDRVIVTNRIGPNAATDPIAQATNSSAINIPHTISSATYTDVQTVVFTPTDSGEAKLTGGCTVTITNPGGAPSEAYLELLLDSTVVDSKRVATGGGPSPTGQVLTHALTFKTDVTVGVSYTFKMRIRQASGDGSSASPGMSVTDRVARAEVNIR